MTAVVSYLAAISITLIGVTKYLSLGVHFGGGAKVCQFDVTRVIQQNVFWLDVSGRKKEPCSHVM